MKKGTDRRTSWLYERIGLRADSMIIKTLYESLNFYNNTKIIYESYPVITTLVRKKCENIIRPPFQFDHLPTQVSKSLYCLKVSECAIIFVPFFGGLAPTFLLFQQTAVQSTIFFLIRTVDKILQTCSVLMNSAATI